MLKMEKNEFSVSGDGEEVLEDFKKIIIGLLEIMPFTLIAKTFKEGIATFGEQEYEKEENHKKISDETMNYIKQIRKMNLIEAKKFNKK